MRTSQPSRKGEGIIQLLILISTKISLRFPAKEREETKRFSFPFLYPRLNHFREERGRERGADAISLLHEVTEKGEEEEEGGGERDTVVEHKMDVHSDAVLYVLYCSSRSQREAWNSRQS